MLRGFPFSGLWIHRGDLQERKEKDDLGLRRPDMRLLTTGDAILGITLAHTHQADVILMDTNLPGMSGIEAPELT